MLFEITEEMRRSFDHFIEHEFSPIVRPVFRDEEEKNKAIKVWWWVESRRRAQARTVHEFRVALNGMIGL